MLVNRYSAVFEVWLKLKLLVKPELFFQLKENLAFRGDDFDSSATLYENLQRILGVDFPRPLDTDTPVAEGSGDCGICYNYHLVVPSTLFLKDDLSRAFPVSSCIAP